MKFTFKERDEPVSTFDPRNDLFDHGRIDPSVLLADEGQRKAVEEAMAVVRAYLDQAEEAGVIDIC